MNDLKRMALTIVQKFPRQLTEDDVVSHMTANGVKTSDAVRAVQDLRCDGRLGIDQHYFLYRIKDWN